VHIILNSCVLFLCLLGLNGCGDASLKDAPQNNPDAMQTQDVDDEVQSLSEADLTLCFNITSGRNAVSELPLQDKARNSFYLECALQNYIGEADAPQSEYDTAQAAQIKNADFLFIRDINSHHNSVNGGQLIFMVINSRLSDKKKFAWVKRLVAEGADVNYMNEYGNEALRAAAFKNLPEIEALLIENGARGR